VSKIIRRRKYDKEFKEQAVRLLLEGEKTTRQLAEELGIHWGMLSRWKREHKAFRDTSLKAMTVRAGNHRFESSLSDRYDFPGVPIPGGL